MTKISIINDEISDKIEDVVLFLQEHKLRYVELRSFNRANIANIPMARLKKYAAYLKKNNIKVSGLASPLLKWESEKSARHRSRSSLSDRHFYDHQGDSARKIFAMADIFGTKYIRIFSFLQYKNFKVSDLDEAVGRLISLAEKHNKILLIENEPVCNINDLDGLIKFIEHFNNRRLRILFDLGNIYKQGNRLDYHKLARIKKYIEYFHIKDYSFDKKQYVALGEGGINYKRFISWIKQEIGGNMFFSLETHVSPGNRRNDSSVSALRLKQLLTGRRVRYGIIGCGRIFKKHASAVKQDGNSELIGVFDINKERGRAAAAAFDGELYSSCERLIADVDVVSICTPHHTHARIIGQVLKQGKKCLCEKPGSLDEADIAAVRSNRNYKHDLFIVYQNRFNRPIIELKKILKKGRLGRMIYIFGSVRWFRPKNYYLRTWQGSKEKEGGIIFNQGAHILDTILSFLPVANKIKIINAFKDKIYHKRINTEDIFIAQFKSGKILANLEITVSALPYNLGSRLFMIFERGRAEIGGQALESSLAINFLDGSRDINFSLPATGDLYGSGHQMLIRKLSRYVRTGHKDKDLVTFDEASRTIRCINRLYEAVK
jgi:predicted dehydrogenase